jgi:hypothetical protein
MLWNLSVSLIFEVLGAFVIWIFQSLFFLLRGKKTRTIKRTWKGPAKSSSSDQLAHAFGNKIVGVIFSVVLMLFLNWLGESG